MINWRASSSGSPRSLQSADFSSCSWRSRLVDDALPGSRDLCSCGRQAIVDDAVPRIRDLHSSPTRNPTRRSIRTCLTNQAMARRLAVSPSVGRTLAWQRATWRAEGERVEREADRIFGTEEEMRELDLRNPLLRQHGAGDPAGHD